MIVVVICLAVLLGVLALRIRGGWPGSAILMEYQRGVLFRRGLPVREVGPGKHRVWLGIEKIITLDTRPVQVSYEKQAVTLSDGLVAIYSFTGSARVKEVRQALYAATNYNHVPDFVLLCSARVELNNSTVAEVKSNPDSIVQRVRSRAKARLEDAGFELLSLRFTYHSIAEQQLAG